eukprot:GFUD01082762.1.p1 GENE.GFUD01082762.1~~GFUD01082762.1.p1  ORF type:complete len:186 (+),score=56.00 GFUD01082762.1:48-605(+)
MAAFVNSASLMARMSSTALRTSMLSTRLFSVGPCLRVKEIVHTESGTKIVVEGVTPPSVTTSVPATTCREGQTSCHPFCRSPIVAQVKHTDVLILDQFVDSRGQIYSQEELGICSRQWTRLYKLVQMCQRAGLMPGKDFYCQDVRKTKWGSQNCYWDEDTIDTQWNLNRRKKKIQEFTSGKFKQF